MRKHYPKMPDRFWAKVDKRGPKECWVWVGARTGQGYGAIKLAGKMQPAHRVAWELEHGPIAVGLIVRHACDNPPCCNPAHLLLGSYADNTADMFSRGRASSPNDRGKGAAKRTGANHWSASRPSNARLRRERDARVAALRDVMRSGGAS